MRNRYHCVFAYIFLVGCSQSAAPPVEELSANNGKPSAVWPQKLASAHLRNPLRLHDKVISGGLPADAAAFQELRERGVKSVISVDGAKPNVELAKKYGLRYVHLPHGYDGIPEQRARELAKAVRELEGPIYIHCHHGKHRSPAAAAVACVTAGLVDAKQALPILSLAGTSENYRGLYLSAAAAKPLDAAVIDQLQVEFHETVAAPPMAEAMVAIEHTHDQINDIAAAGWRVSPRHPDLDPAHEALLLREHFTELLRADYVQSQPAAFHQWLKDSESAAKELEAALHHWRQAGAPTPPPQAFQTALGRLSTNCKKCHQQFRDVPLGEK